MSTKMRNIAMVLTCLGLAIASAAHAGRSCEEKVPPQSATVERGLRLATQTYKALDASGQKVVVLARVGQDLSKYGLRYSHFGFAYQQPDGRGGQVYCHVSTPLRQA